MHPVLWGQRAQDPLVAAFMTARPFGAVPSKGMDLVADLCHKLTVGVLHTKRMISGDEPDRPHKRDGSLRPSSVDAGADPETGVPVSNLALKGTGRHELGLSQARGAGIEAQ